jgi:hypothetical protein
LLLERGFDYRIRRYHNSRGYKVSDRAMGVFFLKKPSIVSV